MNREFGPRDRSFMLQGPSQLAASISPHAEDLTRTVAKQWPLCRPWIALAGDCLTLACKLPSLTHLSRPNPHGNATCLPSSAVSPSRWNNYSEPLFPNWWKFKGTVRSIIPRSYKSPPAFRSQYHLTITAVEYNDLLGNVTTRHRVSPIDYIWAF